MSSTFQRTEPRFGPPLPEEAPAAVEQAPTRASVRLWPWIAAAICAAAASVPSLAVVPERLAGLQLTNLARPAAAPPVSPPAEHKPAPADFDAMVTGSIVGATTPASLLAPSSAPALRLFGVRLAGGESADLLWSHWSELKARFPGVFDGVGTAVRPIPGSTTPARFELMAGRYRNAAEAAALCGRLRAHDIPCAVRDLEDIPTGQPG